MHSGHPIVVPMGYADSKNPNFMFTTSIFCSGYWDVYHMIAENLIKPQSALEKGLGDALCDVFTLYALKKVSDQDPWIHPYLAGHIGKAKNFLKKANTTLFKAQVADARLALFPFAQLIHHFGWGIFQKLFRQIAQMATPERPATETEQLNQLMSRCSHITGLNLCPFFDFWGFPLPDSVIDSTKFLQEFLPNDELMEMVPERVQTILEKYPGCIRETSHLEEIPIAEKTPMCRPGITLEDDTCTEVNEPQFEEPEPEDTESKENLTEASDKVAESADNKAES